MTIDTPTFPDERSLRAKPATKRSRFNQLKIAVASLDDPLAEASSPGSSGSVTLKPKRIEAGFSYAAACNTFKPKRPAQTSRGTGVGYIEVGTSWDLEAIKEAGSQAQEMSSYELLQKKIRNQRMAAMKNPS